MYEYLRQPEARTKLDAEIKSQLGAHGRPTIDALGKLSYLDIFVKEVLRIHPVAYVVDRELVNDYTYKGMHLKKGVFAKAGDVKWEIFEFEND